MSIEENYAKLTKMLLDNQTKFYQDNQKIDSQYLAYYGQIVEEPDDDQSKRSEPQPPGSGEADPKPGTDQPTP